jgi:hypothetical protein
LVTLCILWAARKKQAAEIAQKTADAARKEQVSRDSLRAYLKRYLDFKIYQGAVTPDDFKSYFAKLPAFESPEEMFSTYVTYVVKVLHNPLIGIETTSARLANGEIKWNGKCYKDITKLFEAVERLLGDSPVQTLPWFTETVLDILNYSIEDMSTTWLDFAGKGGQYWNIKIAKLLVAHEPPKPPTDLVMEVYVQKLLGIGFFGSGEG